MVAYSTPAPRYASCDKHGFHTELESRCDLAAFLVHDRAPHPEGGVLEPTHATYLRYSLMPAIVQPSWPTICWRFQLHCYGKWRHTHTERSPNVRAKVGLIGNVSCGDVATQAFMWVKVTLANHLPENDGQNDGQRSSCSHRVTILP